MTDTKNTNPTGTDEANDRSVFPVTTGESNERGSTFSETEEAIERNTFSTKTEESKKRTVPDRVLWGRFYQYLKPYRKNLIFSFFAIVGGALTGSGCALPAWDGDQYHHFACGKNG